MPLRPLWAAEDGLHAHRPADPGHALAEHAFADDAEGAAGELVDGIVKEAEVPALLPTPASGGLGAGEQIAARGEDQGEGAKRCKSLDLI
jgi:hypothetical protein